MAKLNAKTQSFIKSMEKKFGVNVLRPARDIVPITMKRVSTGSVGLDIAINGGYPVGRFIQIRGHFSASKSSLAYHAIKNFQSFFKEMGLDLMCVLIQGEQGSFTQEYAEQIGIDLDRLMVSESSSMEEALEIAVQLQKEQIVGLVVHDSFASYIPMKEQDSDMDESVQMGLKPKLLDEYCRKYQAVNNKLVREGKFPCTVIGLNQIREKIGAYGDPEYSPGGRAIGHTSSLDINLKRGDWIKRGKGANAEIIGQEVKYKIAKSKVSVPYKTGAWDFYLEDDLVPKGHIDTFKETVLESIVYGVVQRSGSWFTYKDLTVQGAENLVDELRNNPELYEEIKMKTLDIALTKHNEVYIEKVESGEINPNEENLDEVLSSEEKNTVKREKPVRKKPVTKAKTPIKRGKGK